jgi:predicted nucleotidyltransferase component of viral defense system
MITAVELKKFAAAEGIPFHSTEKDYVIGWALWGIANHPTLSKEFVFKGGTALRKCYFKEYRFSEDLDFTIQRAPLNIEKLKQDLTECAASISKASGIEMSLAGLDQTRDKEGEEALKGKFAYIGPSKQVRIKPTIKLDLTYYEKVIEGSVQRPIIARYSDAENAKIQVYKLEEIVAEKMRSMLQQIKHIARPRDWYDVWYLLTNEDMDWPKIRALFHAKCSFKNVEFKNTEDFFDTTLLEKISGAWESSLEHQLKDVPPFKQVRKELRLLLEPLNSKSR